MKDYNGLLQNNNECIEKIDEKFLEVVNDIVSYIRVKLAEGESEEAINDILDIFLEAQNNGKDINTIIGEDFQKFADEFISSYKCGEKYYFIKRISNVLKECIYMLPIILIVHIISIAPYEESSFIDFSNYDYDITGMHILFVLGVITITYVISYMHGVKTVVDKRYKIKGLTECMAGILGLAWALYWAIGPTFEDVIIIAIPNYMICYIVAIIGLIIYSLIGIKSLYNYKEKYNDYIRGGKNNE